MDSNQFNNLEEDETTNQSSNDAYRLQLIDEANEELAERKQEEADIARQEDPRNVEEGIGGLQGLIKEGQSILSGGLQDTASSIATFPERTVDALSGQMQKEKRSLVIINLTGLLLEHMIILSKQKLGGVNSLEP